MFAGVLLMAATSMYGSRITAVDPEILALRQESLALIRKQLTSPDLSGTPEHVASIQFLAAASLVGIYCSYREFWN